MFKITFQMLFHSISTKLLPDHTLLYYPFSSLPLFYLCSVLLVLSQYCRTFKGGRLVSPILFLSVSLCLLIQMILPTIFSFFFKKSIIFPFVLLFMLGPVQLSSDQQYSITASCILFHTDSFPSCCLLPFF